MKIRQAILATLVAILVAATCCVIFISPAGSSESAVLSAPTTAIRLSHETLTMGVGEGAWIHIIGDAPLESVQWSSSDPGVATVSSGLVRAQSVGTVVISCTDGISTTSCLITIQEEMDRNYTLSGGNSRMFLTVGDCGTLECIYTGPGTLAIWSSDPQVLRVENGQYQAVSAGTAIITCTDGFKHRQYKVTVEAPSPEG